MMSIILLIAAHLLGDFYLQPDSLVKRKRYSFRHILLHSGIYALPFIVLFLAPIPSRALALLWLLIAVASHILIDGLKSLLQRHRKKTVEKDYRKDTTASLVLFFADQLLHLAVLLLLSSLFQPAQSLGLGLIDWLKSNLSFLSSFSEAKIGIILIVLLILYKPVAIINSYLLNYFPLNAASEEYKDSASAKAGYLIGWLERTFVLILCFYGQIGSIGLVLTAKSIARYKQLEKQDFAERYLFGTLFSVLEAVAASILILNILV
jgi:hypothetical protein